MDLNEKSSDTNGGLATESDFTPPSMLRLMLSQAETLSLFRERSAAHELLPAACSKAPPHAPVQFNTIFSGAMGGRIETC
jgi:hypothetical protein